MKELWRAFVARVVWLLTPKPPVIVQAPEPPLKPGICQCDHIRSCHVGGTGKCTVAYPANKEWPNGAVCACKIFILDDDDDSEDEPETPSPSELERMFKL